MSVDPAPVAHGDRWAWLKTMMAQPKEVLSPATKIVLVAIWEAMDRKAGVTVRQYSTIAQAVGMTASGVRACVSKAKQAGFLHSEGSGGIRYDEQGQAVGIANRFTMTLPATAIAGMSAPRCYETESKVLQNDEQGAMESVARCYGHSDNTPSLPLSLPHTSPESVLVAHGEPTEPQTDRYLEREESQREVAIALPEPQPLQRALWSGHWPDQECYAQIGQKACAGRIGTEAVKLLGYTFDTCPVVDGQRLDRHIVTTLPIDQFQKLVELMSRGKLTKMQLANVLAANDFAPAIEAKHEAL